MTEMHRLAAVEPAETWPSGVDTSCDAAWYVLQTQRHRERVAQGVLAEREVLSYLPMIEQWPRPVVGSAIAPMFPGYLFVLARLANDFTRIARTPGVKEFVRFGVDPATVDEGVIDFLRSRECPDGVIRYDQGPKERSEVRIIQGPFRGLTAIVEERLPARERICVLMHILQRETRVELPERWVRLA
jgi:transcription elongation factor/antiterminator RfaH